MDKQYSNDIREWEDAKITKDFFEIVRNLMEREDASVHKHLRVESFNQDSFYQAALANAGMEQLQEILNIPERMKENAT